MLRVARAAALLLAAPAAAQQSLWNVPAGTGTPTGGFFFQEQLNLSRAGESNLTAAVGVGKGVELGLNLFHAHLYGAPSPHTARNMLMANAVFTLDVNDWLTLQLGGQAGFGRDEHLRREVPVGFGYVELRAHPHELKLAAVLGVWAATESYVGKGWPLGPMLGLEYELVHEWLVLQGDLLIGDHEAAVGVLGAVVLLPFGWQVAVGLQVPSPFSRNSLGAVIELTHVPPGTGDRAEPVRWQKDRFSPKWIREHRAKHGIGGGDDDDLAEPPPSAE